MKLGEVLNPYINAKGECVVRVAVSKEFHDLMLD